MRQAGALELGDGLLDDRVPALAKTVNVVSAMSAPETSGVLSQYGIGCHALPPMASIAARTRLSCRAVMENRTSNFAAVLSTALE